MMIILLLLLGIALSYIVMYRKQVKSLVKQLKFHNQEESNKEIAIDCRSTEIIALQSELNTLLGTIKTQRQMYEQSEKELHKLITDISHDIRTPLTSVKGYFQMLETCGSEEKEVLYKEIISSRLETINVMLDDFFVYTKTSQKELNHKVDEYDIKQLLCETLFAYYDDFIAKGFEVQLNIPEDEMLVVMNEEEIKRIFLNLIKNVLVHGCEKLVVTLMPQSKELVFENHTQEPIPYEIEDVFKRFYKGDVARSQRLSTGLGLSIVKELMHKNQGEAVAFSKHQHHFGIRLIFGEEIKNEENLNH